MGKWRAEATSHFATLLQKCPDDAAASLGCLFTKGYGRVSLISKPEYMKPSEIPYLRSFPNDGRIRPLLTFFNEHGWHHYHMQSEFEIVDVPVVNLLDGIYLSDGPAAPEDTEILLLTFFFQHFPTPETFRAFEKLDFDLGNALAVLEKQFIFHRHFRGTSNLSFSQIVGTEIEYALFNHRSAYDLLHGLVIVLMRVHRLGSKTIPDSFRRLAEKSPEERERYGFPKPLAEFYQRRAERFMLYRDLRDAVGHHGDSVRAIYCLDEGFGLGPNCRIARKLKEAKIWQSLSPNQQDIGSCLAFLALLTSDIFDALSDFTEALAASFSTLPTPTAEGFHIFRRTLFYKHQQNLNSYIERPWDSMTQNVPCA